jgi:secreted PhoX family phosphatase
MGDYQVLLQSGDILSDGNQAGGIYAADDGQELFISQKPDYNAFVPLNEEGTQGYVYTAWEDRPAGISQIQINWNSTTSEWDVLNSQMLNLSDINGAWVLCFGSMSPWGTPLFSEELYFDDTEEWNDDSFRYHSDQLLLADYLGVYPNPYDYGYIVEMGEPESTNPDLIRQLTMGRFSHENAMVMPDNKTVYLTDDGYDTVLFKYIAKRSGDLE